MLDKAPGLLLSDDLVFASRISGTARGLGFEVITLRSAAELLDRAGEQSPPCVIVDLANPGLKVAELVRHFRACEEPPFIVGYGSHVDAASLRAARDAGCDLVLPRSKFVQDLPTALPQWFGEKPGGQASR